MRTYGGSLRLGVPITEEISGQIRYSAYSREIELEPINNCYPSTALLPGGYPDPVTGDLIGVCVPAAPALRAAAADGSVFTSLVGYTLAYNTLDNNKNPRKGILAELKQDFAGAGGD